MARECGLSELMELPMETPTQRQIVDSSYMYVHPVGSLVDAKEVEFLINNDGQKFLDLANSEVLTTFRVKKGKGVDLTATDNLYNSIINKRVEYSIPRVVLNEFLDDKGGKSFNIPKKMH